MLEALYRRYDDRAFVHPDPLETVYDFSDEIYNDLDDTQPHSNQKLTLV